MFYRLLSVLVIGAGACVSVPSDPGGAGSTAFVDSTPPASDARYHISGTYVGVDQIAFTLSVDNHLAEIQQLFKSSPFAFVTPLRQTTPFSVAPVTLSQTCRIDPAAGSVPAGDILVTARCGVRLTFDNGQAASGVMGQPDFTSSGSRATDSNTLQAPSGLWYDGYAGRLFIADSGNNRILGFQDQSIVGARKTALFNLGQADYSGSAGGTSAATMRGPSALGSDNALLGVADLLNNRVLLYRPFPSFGRATPAALVLGQNNFSASGAACGASGLNQPTSVKISGGRLVLADSGNNRVLIWNALPKAMGQAPDLVLGQASLDSCAATTPPSASTLAAPNDTWSDGIRLVVADTGNNRVLIWNTFPTQSAQPADVVLGQSAMDQSAPGRSAVALARPIAVHSNNLHLFVGDADNHRVLIWYPVPSLFGSPAEAVLGQPTFTDGAASVTATGLSEPAGFETNANQLLVSDRTANRVMVYSSR